jgi:hypothetical protein
LKVCVDSKLRLTCFRPYQIKIKGIPIAGQVPASGVDQALALLTNQSIASDSFSSVSGDLWNVDFGHTSVANVAKSLQQALQDHEPVTALAADSELAKIGFHDQGPLAEDHIFSVLDFKNGIVPWGYNNKPFDDVYTPGNILYLPVDAITSLPNGLLQMPLLTFMKYFSSDHFAGIQAWDNDFENLENDFASHSFFWFGNDLLYMLTDQLSRGAKNVYTGVAHGVERLVHDL